MKQVAPDLWQSQLCRSGILSTHAYFLERPSGNVLFYNTGDEDDLRHMSDRGGIAWQLLTHRDEAGPSQARIRDRFGCKLGCSAIETPFVAKHGKPDLEFNDGDDRIVMRRTGTRCRVSVQPVSMMSPSARRTGER